MASTFSPDSIRRLVAICVGDAGGWTRPASESDWTELVRAASFHGVRPLLWGGLEERKVALPRKIRAPLAGFTAYNRYVSRILCDREEQLADSLAKAGLRHRLLKGPRTATAHYGVAGLREAGDLDLLIAPETLEGVDRALRGLGYVPWMLDEPSFGRSKEILYRSGSAEPFPVWVDVHQRLFSAAVDDPLTRVMLYEEPTPESTLVYTAAHAAAHRLARLKHLVDVHRILESGARLDWSRVRELARKTVFSRGIELAFRRVDEISPGSAHEWTTSGPPMLPRTGRMAVSLLTGSDVVSSLARGPRLRGVRGVAVTAILLQGMAARARQLRRAVSPDMVEIRQAYARTATESPLRVWWRRVTSRLWSHP